MQHQQSISCRFGKNHNANPYYRLLKLKEKYANLRVTVRSDIASNMMVYVKEDVVAVMVKKDTPPRASSVSRRTWSMSFGSISRGNTGCAGPIAEKKAARRALTVC